MTNRAPRPTASAAQRFDRLQAALAKLPEALAAELLAALDEISCPMTIREIERSITAHGASRSQAKKLANAINAKGILLVMMNPERMKDE